MKQGNHKIAVIVVFFGKWPDWLGYYLFSCSKQPELNFIFFSDEVLPEPVPINVDHYQFTLGDFSELARVKLHINPKMEKAYKVCDFKPTYGVIFEKYIRKYDFWAYSDIDLIFGDLSSTNLYSLLELNDVVSGYQGFASGPFCLYRNSSKINNLFKQISNYKEILESPDYQGIDEHIIKRENVGFSFRKAILLLKFLIKKTIGAKLLRTSFKQFKYDFQWFVKRNTISIPVDITEVILEFYEQKRINACFTDLITNDTDFHRNGINKWSIDYNFQKLTSVSKENGIPVFHFIKSKNNNSFEVEKVVDEPRSFKITPQGIQNL